MSLQKLPKDQQKEFERTGKISSPEFLASATHDVLDLPFNPYDYQTLLSNNVIGTVPKEALGTRVAIIGAGAAGLCAAYELMKVGLVPVIYEASGRIGGRICSCPIKSDPASVLELGAMRVPTEQKTFAFYQKEFKIDAVPFPNPGHVDTMLWWEDKEPYRWYEGAEPPQAVMDISKKFVAFLADTMRGAGGSGNSGHVEKSVMWDNLVRQFENSNLLSALTTTGNWSFEELKVLGILGLGTGGLSAQLQVAALEMFRAALGVWIDDQLILGNDYGVGMESLTKTFWRQEVSTPGGVTSVKKMQDKESVRPAVVAIRSTAGRKGVEVEDVNGHCETFAATILTCTTRAAQLGIHIDNQLLSNDVWGAMRRVHYMSSTKIMCSSKTKFWKEENLPVVTLTDRPTRATYFLDYGEDAKGGALLLSYTWGDDSNKLLALSESELRAMCENVLGELYGQAFSKQELSDFRVVSWQQEPGYNGAFRLNYAGQYRDHNALFNQARDSVKQGSKDGFFLSGEGASWEGGWIEGGLQSGLDASCCTIRLLGGTINA
jgi:tryptophan 2-monooxygenase